MFMVDYKSGDELRILPCKHVFHKPSIDEWLNNKGRPKPGDTEIVRGLASCPLCKKVPISVPDPPKLKVGKGQRVAPQGQQMSQLGSSSQA